MIAIPLPDLTPEQALLLYESLADFTAAIWEAHEPERDQQARVPAGRA